jgi:hypothetical protein
MVQSTVLLGSERKRLRLVMIYRAGEGFKGARYDAIKQDQLNLRRSSSIHFAALLQGTRMALSSFKVDFNSTRTIIPAKCSHTLDIRSTPSPVCSTVQIAAKGVGPSVSQAETSRRERLVPETRADGSLLPASHTPSLTVIFPVANLNPQPGSTFRRPVILSFVLVLMEAIGQVMQYSNIT